MELRAPKTTAIEEFPFDFPAGAYEVLRDILKERRDFDIANYKDKYIKRRIAIRVRATQCASVEDYCGLLLRSEGELDHLLKGLTIHVSQFFRNWQAFEKLRRDILPPFFEQARREGRDSLTFWSVGCSSGEEPYTIAILLRDFFAAELERFKVSLIATDINESILETARRGYYGPERLQEMPEEVRERWFVQERGRYILLPEIREMVTFRRGDLFDVDSYPESDLVLCRNVLIYFERKEQVRIIHGLANALRTGGVLVLGKAETLVGDTRRRFSTLCPIERIYMKLRSLT